jgi:hypothetical protein
MNRNSSSPSALGWFEKVIIFDTHHNRARLLSRDPARTKTCRWQLFSLFSSLSAYFEWLSVEAVTPCQQRDFWRKNRRGCSAQTEAANTQPAATAVTAREYLDL